MENINFDENLSQIKLDKAKAVANMLNETWNGQVSNQNAGSYVDGVRKEMEENSGVEITRNKPSFSVGVLETALALHNSSFKDLQEGNILTQKYINAATVKGISEAFLIESMMQELEVFSWENNAKESLANLKKTYNSNRREIEVAKAIEEINRSGGKDLFSSITESMRNWLSSKERITESLVKDIRKWIFNSTVKRLIENLNAIDAATGNKFAVSSNNQNCEVKSIVAPTLVFENSSVFVTSDRFFLSEDNEIVILERNQAAKLPSKFLKAVMDLTQPNVKINENGADLYLGKNKLSVVVESYTELKNVYYNGKRMPNDKLGFMLSMELRNSFQNSQEMVNQALSLVESVDYLAEVDFGKKIVSKIYEGVEANIFKTAEKVYVHRVNPAMKKNELFEGNGNQAVNLVKEFLGFDLSESMSDVLGSEDQLLAIMRNDKADITKNISIVESEINKLNKAIQENPILEESEEIQNAKNMLKNESESLKNKWNQINVEIERFEKGYRKADVSESEGYAINTDVRIKRNGEKGVVVGVNGNSKTYTVMFENGKTGEFFFSDVMDMTEELEHTDLEEYADTEEAYEKLDPNFATAPKGSGKKSSKFIADEKGANLAKAPGSKAAADAKFIDDLKDHALASISKGGSKNAETKSVSKGGLANGLKGGTTHKGGKAMGAKDLAEAPGSTAKTGSKFIDNLKNANLAESQHNKHVEKAPKAKSIKTKEFVEDLDDAELAEAPGNHKKNGKKDHEALNRANLASAPKAKKK
jgi:hypothetical protein